jgi:hypothetical protein
MRAENVVASPDLVDFCGLQASESISEKNLVRPGADKSDKQDMYVGGYVGLRATFSEW